MGGSSCQSVLTLPQVKCDFVQNRKPGFQCTLPYTVARLPVGWELPPPSPWINDYSRFCCNTLQRGGKNLHCFNRVSRQFAKIANAVSSIIASGFALVPEVLRWVAEQTADRQVAILRGGGISNVLQYLAMFCNVRQCFAKFFRIILELFVFAISFPVTKCFDVKYTMIWKIIFSVELFFCNDQSSRYSSVQILKWTIVAMAVSKLSVQNAMCNGTVLSVQWRWELDNAPACLPAWLIS